MGKYFSNDSDFSQYNLEEEKHSNVIPSTDNLTKPLSDKTKEKLSRTPNDAVNEDDYINLVKEQTEQVSSMISKYSEESKQELHNQFKKFQPVEIFEKLNQLIFVVAQLNNKISKLENTLLGIEEEKQNRVITDPAQLYKLQEKEKMLENINIPENIPVQEIKTPDNFKKNERPDINVLRQQINDAKNGKKIPNYEYSDNSINLEEVFPDLDDEAYQAAYASSMRLEKTKSKAVEQTPTPGKMKGITGF